MEIRCYHLADESEVIALWDACDLIRPWNNASLDIQRKLKVQPELFLVGIIDQKIIASVMGGYEGHRGWVNYLAVSPDHQNQGLGRRLMGELEQRLKQAGCPKINLQIRASNSVAVDFYEKCGYKQDAVLSYGKRLVQDE